MPYVARQASCITVHRTTLRGKIWMALSGTKVRGRPPAIDATRLSYAAQHAAL
jgi:hypothetical protein